MPIANDQWLILIVRFVHILAGVMWIGALLYNTFVVSRKMMPAPPQVRGPAMGLIGPAGLKYATYAGAVTVLFGALNQVLIAREGAAPGPEWHMILGIAFLASVVMLGIAGGIVGPTLKKMAAQPPPEQAAALSKRLKMASFTASGIGVAIVFMMVYATKLRLI